MCVSITAMIKILFFCVLCMAEAYLNNGLLSISITRHHKGDIFIAQGDKCYKDFCIGLSSGTAGPSNNDECECKCLQHLPVFRDDLNICVDDIQECALVPFGSGTTIKKIPYVFLPLKGQIVYPSAEIIISDVGTPVCVVSGGQFLGQSGWLNLRNSSGAEPPFRVFRDEGRTYLQWLGETSLRVAMEGRIILVHLMCKDASATEEPKIFTPCIAFRVAGNPSIREVTFATDVHLREEYGEGLSVREYVAIGICSLLLAIVYVVSVFLYLHLRKRKQKKTNKKGCGEDAQLTLGEEGIIKNNPLLQASRHLTGDGHDNAGYNSDSISCCSDTDQTSDLLCLDEDDLIMRQNLQTSAIIHPCDLEFGEAVLNQDSNSIEKLPEENVSIVETLEVKEDHPETIKAMSSANGRRKLYFNPSYFEPDLLKAPPPAALEFLTKIREVIAIAKHKMSAKKFCPSLLGIPEEDGSLRTDNSAIEVRKDPAEKGNAEKCDENTKSHSSVEENVESFDYNLVASDFCCPSDAKQRIIRKWLEDIPVMMLKADEYKSKLANQNRLRTASEENKISKSPQFNEEKPRTITTNSTKVQEINKVPVPPAKQDKKRPSTKGRAPPLPPQHFLRSSDAKSKAENPENNELERKECRNKTELPSFPFSLPFAKANGLPLSKPHSNVKSECATSANSKIIPPQPPPLPSSSFITEPDEVPRVQGKDRVPPVVAKNLMDAVIQELTGFKRNDKTVKPKAPAEQTTKANEGNNERTQVMEENKASQVKKQDLNRQTVEEKQIQVTEETNNKKNGDLHRNDPPDNGFIETFTQAKSTGTITKRIPDSGGNDMQDDHEYEVILLNPDLKPFTEEKSKDLKIYNLPEILSKSDRNEGYSLVSEVYVNDGYSCCSSGESPPSSCSNSSAESEKIRYEIMNEKPGRLTIHVNDSPEQYKDATSEADNFEPDTLDRKPHKSKQIRGMNGRHDESERYSNQKFHDMEYCNNSNNSAATETFTDSLERSSIMLKTNGSFKRNSLEKDINDLFRSLNWTRVENFGSLREIYEAKGKKYNRRTETTSLIDSLSSDNDCISTLSWGEDRKNKLLRHGIILHINEEGSRKHKNRIAQRRSHAVREQIKEKQSARVPSEKVPTRPPKPCPSPRSRSQSPASQSNCASPFSKSVSDIPKSPVLVRSPVSPRSLSPPLPPPRSVPVSPLPFQLQNRSANSSPITTEHMVGSRKTATPTPHSSGTNSVVRVSSKSSIASTSWSSCSSPNPSSIQPVSLSSLPPSLSAPPRPPKTQFESTPPLPPRNTKPPLPPKNVKSTRQKSAPSKFATRPLPPLPPSRPTKSLSSSPLPNKDLETLSVLSGASMDSLNSSEYEAFYTLPYEEEEGVFDARDDLRVLKNSKNVMPNTDCLRSDSIVVVTSTASPIFNASTNIFDTERRKTNPFRNQRMHGSDKKSYRGANRAIPHRPDDSGYLSTDSNDSCCPAQMILSPHIPRIPEKLESYGSQNSETEESFCDGASESGAESMATDSFFYGNFQKARGDKPQENGLASQVYPYSLRLSDSEVKSDTERCCLPIMVSP